VEAVIQARPRRRGRRARDAWRKRRFRFLWPSSSAGSARARRGRPPRAPSPRLPPQVARVAEGRPA